MVEWRCISDSPEWKLHRAPITLVPGTQLWLVAETHSQDGVNWVCTGLIDEGPSEMEDIKGSVEGAKYKAELLALKVMENFVWGIDRICHLLSKEIDRKKDDS